MADIDDRYDERDARESPPARRPDVDGLERDERHERGSRGHRDEYDRDRERDRGDRDRSERRHRGDRDDRDRDYDRYRRSSRDGGRDGGRDDRDRRRRSHDVSRSRSRSRSPRDRGDRRSKRQSGFDMAPPGATIPPMPVPGILNNPGAGPLPAIGTIGGQLGLGQPGMPNMFPNMFPMMGTQATRHARRVYVGGLPPMANEQSVATYFSQVMAAVGGNTAGPGDAVVNVYINQEKKFAFVEMRTVEEASNAIALDGIIFEGVSVRVRRPSDYNPSMAATLGPSQPSPHLNLAAVGLTPGYSNSAAGGADGPDRIFVGGLPYYLTEEQIKELLSSFGPLRAFDLVKDRDTGNSKGYGFCVYQDPAVTDVACAALNGMKMGDKTLTVRRATASGQPKPDQANVLAQAQQQIALQFALGAVGSGANSLPLGSGLPGLMPGLVPGIGSPGMPGGVPEVPTKVVCLAQVVAPNELIKDDEYEEILEDMREECGKYGTVANLVIPRPGPNGENLPGVGKVFVEYTTTEEAQKAKQTLNGRKFGGNSVIALYYPEERFARADYAGQ